MFDPIGALINYLISGPIIKFLLSPTYVTGPHEFYFQGPVILLIAIVFLSIASLVWVWKDARKRGKSGFITLLFILLTGWPASFIWWFWLRPPVKYEMHVSNVSSTSLSPAPYPKGA